LSLIKKMKSMKNTGLKLVTAMVVVLMMGMNSNLFAQKGNGQGNGQGNGLRQGPGQGQMCANLNLSDEQTKSIEKLRVTHQKEMLQHRNEMAELKAKLTTLRSADKADMNAINSTIDKISILKTQQMKQKEAHIQDVRKLLTDEQRVQFDLHQGKKGKGNGKGNGNCQGNGGGKGYGRP